MARTFDGVGDVVTCSVGATGSSTFGTFAAIVKRNGTAIGSIGALNTVTPTTILAMAISSNAFGNFLEYGNNASAQFSTTITITNADNWVLVVAGKATGTVAPRFHKYAYGSGTWTHEDAGGTLANATGTVSSVTFGQDGGTDDYAGDMAVAAFWKNRQLTDAEVELLPFTIMGWHALTPTGLWVFDQHATTQNVIDLSGNGSNQSGLTGTAVSANSVPIFSYGYPVQVLSSSASVAATAVPYNPQRYAQFRDYGEVPWIQRDRRDVNFIATAANDLNVPLLAAEHLRTTVNLSRYVDRRGVPQQPDRHLRALDAAAANDLAPPLMAPSDALYWHLYNDVPLRDRRGQQRIYADPSLLTPVVTDIPTASPLAVAAYAERRVTPKQRVYTDPTLLDTALIENELLGGAETSKRTNTPATNTDRREVPQQRAYFDPTLLASALLENELLGGAETDKRTNVPATHADRREVPQQRLYYDTSLLATALLENGFLGFGDAARHYLVAATHVSRRQAGQQRVYYDLTLLSSALLENELLGGADTVKRHLPATHYSRRLVPQERSYVSDPGLLSTALLEDVLLGGADDLRRRWYDPAAYVSRRQTGYQPRWPDPSQFVDVFDPTSVAAGVGGDLWRRLNTPATHASRRETVAQPLRVTLYFDAGPDSPPLTLAWGVGGDLWHRYNPRRPARSWWPQWFAFGPYDVGELCITIRPTSGTTLRPGTGVTAYALGVTVRPGSGVTVRPDTGETADPC